MGETIRIAKEFVGLYCLQTKASEAEPKANSCAMVPTLQEILKLPTVKIRRNNKNPSVNEYYRSEFDGQKSVGN
ncbi:unnamed protein product [Sphenostylis stenocarpa]|uniref:Uncharacterized protein n=1 Tax=Sphenostylis stenocarpa TaxID=92480 RepID=A0AA86S8W5_9FABA|nr:unnamed protein product [Sphenostylis stenocarpa]